MHLDDKSSLPEHFKGKEAVAHVAEAQAQGIISAAEIHGVEIPGYLSSGADAARETALVLLLIWILLQPFFIPFTLTVKMLVVFSLGWLLWKSGRSAWFGWTRLERLHRILEQERWEIQHHRQQERSELKALYAAKGLEGKLLDDVIDVMMADDNRLLRIMVEEELGLTLASTEHPLQQGLGAAFGCLLSSLACLLGLFLYSSAGIVTVAACIVGLSGFILAYYSENRLIPAVIWNVGLAALACGTVYFFLRYFLEDYSYLDYFF